MILSLHDWELRFDTAKGGSYGLSFKKDHQFELFSGGIMYKGKYTITSGDDQNILHLLFAQSEIIGEKSFYFEVKDNSSSESVLCLTDLDGLFLRPDSADSYGLEQKGNLAEKYKKGDKIYYILPFKATERVGPERKQFENPKTDKQLLGTWYHEDEETGTRFTITFCEDGTFDQLFIDHSVFGCYAADNGACSLKTIRWEISAVTELTYSVTDHTLVLDEDARHYELVRTDDPYIFESATD